MCAQDLPFEKQWDDDLSSELQCHAEWKIGAGLGHLPALLAPNIEVVGLYLQQYTPATDTHIGPVIIMAE